MKSVSELSPTDIIVFGGNGDLAMRKIMPALYYRFCDGQLPASSRVIGAARQVMSSEEYRGATEKAVREFVRESDFDETVWKAFRECIHYIRVDAKAADHYDDLGKLIDSDSREVRVFYLATPADIFGTICANLKAAGLVTPDSRVVLEKPLGYDLASFREINEAVMANFEERQIYRIDHYLGKETVQNLMVLRFANNLFERVWKGDAVDHVQITVAESIGVGTRAGYYDNSGALRDMVQNHLLQLLCLVAMEPPSQIEPNLLRDEKLKVLRALRPITAQDVSQYTVRGQYKAGAVDGKPAPSYLEDTGIDSSNTETFVAIKAHVDNWRWSNVPFYLRTGKRLAERYSEIVIHFRPVPHSVFPGRSSEPETNKLIIRLQPDESVKLEMITKVPGPGGYRLKPVHLNLSLTEAFDERTPDAYERLLMDVVRGNPTLFMRSDEVEAAWVWTDDIIRGWKEASQSCKLYPAGSWGPSDAFALLAADNRRWFEINE